MTLANGRPVDRGKKYAIAFNSFDSRSGGHHFMKLRALLERPEANYILHPVQTRDALIDYFAGTKLCTGSLKRARGSRRLIGSADSPTALRSCKSESFRLPISPCGLESVALFGCCSA